MAKLSVLEAALLIVVLSTNVIGGRHITTQNTAVSIQHYKVYIPTSSSVYGDVGVPPLSKDAQVGLPLSCNSNTCPPGPRPLLQPLVHYRYAAGLSLVLGLAVAYAVVGGIHASAGAQAVAYAVAYAVAFAVEVAFVSASVVVGLVAVVVPFVVVHIQRIHRPQAFEDGL